MNHDELLAKVSIPIILKAGIQETDIVNVELLIKERQALRAVVEMHKPSERGYKGDIGCVGCGVNAEYGTWEMDYPCPTIQAIEKELG
jgi:hypothetical protein